MSYETLAIERRGAVATLWMDRPAVFNAFNEQLIAELAAACAELDADASVRVVVLAGRGKHFSAGADLNWMRRAADSTEAENLADSRKFAAMLRALSGMSKPTIARVQGAALGGGTGLTAACDMAIAADDASFATSEVKFGIIPAVISPYVLRAIGPRHALRYFQSAERFGAAEAKAMGLVHTVSDDPEAAAMAYFGEHLAGKSAAALACALLAARGAMLRDVRHRLAEVERLYLERLMQTRDANEGLVAFLAKRKPLWEHH